jgi:hypothetical protein
MTLTGVPLIVLVAAVTVGAGVVIVRGWSRRRWPARAVGVLVVEALVVLTLGLIVNRAEGFYPSWQALRGDTGTVAVAEPVVAGALDGRVPDGPFLWRPPGLSAWKLAEPPTITLPVDYEQRSNVTFPVVVFVGVPARRTPEAVTLTLAPTGGTTLHGLPAQLRHDLRVAETGWAVVGDSRLVGLPPRPVDALPPALAPPLQLPS